jgi:hypothetical protein
MGCEISEIALHHGEACSDEYSESFVFLDVEIVAIFATGATQSSADIRRIRGRWLTRKLWSMASLLVKG